MEHQMSLMETKSTGYEAYAKGLDELRRLTSEDAEYWMARDIMPLLAYADWENFEPVIERARSAAVCAGAPVDNHFLRVADMVAIGSGARRERGNWYLSRYACYLIAMNADSRKPQVGYAMTYFAGKTHQMEQLEHGSIEEQERLKFRLRTIANNKRLAGVAKRSGVIHIDRFHDAGYRGFYGGMSVGDVKDYKGIAPKEELLDRIGSLELSAHDFRQKVIEEHLINSRVETEENALATHRRVGEEVRAIIRGDNGKKPEDLPPAPSIRKLVNRHRKNAKIAGA